ncbi:hypothetical protein V6238_19130, partial [Marinomonas arenicola]|uniref:hypothetical protein n=1 Tax=Marinomonas arenicola TaxID=569601 RepID=UPI0031204AAE
NDSKWTIDTTAPTQNDIAINTASTLDLELIDESTSYLEDVESYRVGDNGDFVVAWITNSEESESNYLFTLFYNADGSANWLPHAVSAGYLMDNYG